MHGVNVLIPSTNDQTTIDEEHSVDVLIPSTNDQTTIDEEQTTIPFQL